MVAERAIEARRANNATREIVEVLIVEEGERIVTPGGHHQYTPFGL